MTNGMTDIDELQSGKGHRDENFPVASCADRAAPLAPAILAFYRFARAADDIADHPDSRRRRKSCSCSKISAPA